MELAQHARWVADVFHDYISAIDGLGTAIIVRAAAANESSAKLRASGQGPTGPSFAINELAVVGASCAWGCGPFV